MKLYRLGANQLRIHLSREDLEAYALTSEELDYESARGKRVIRRIFDRAREETGFDAAHERIYIQMYPISDGGCELFVTKLERDEVKYDCFFFENFDAFFAGSGLMDQGAKCYRVKDSGAFLALIPREAVPPEILEFSEAVKTPSPIYLKRKCRRIHRKREEI